MAAGIINIRDFGPTAQIREVPAANVKVHEFFSATSLQNDIALIRLNVPFELNDAVQTVALPRRQDISFTWLAGIAIGWGQTSDSESSLSDNLRWGESFIETNSECSSYFPGIITANHLCATGVGGRSICHGDNGGPIIVQHNDEFMQVGVASFVHSVCETGYPGVFTRLTAYLDWIQINSDVIIRP